MAQVIHVRCDRCGKSVARQRGRANGKGWANVTVNYSMLDFCPDCWRTMMELAAVTMPEEEDG